MFGKYKNKAGPSNIESFSPYKSYLLLGFFLILTIFVTYLLYLEVQSLFKDRLQERILSIAQTAAIHFDPKTLAQIDGVEDIDSEQYTKVINELNRVRAVNKNLKFAYILRKTNNPDIFTFVADADSINPSAEIDLNNDGIVDDNDALAAPGDEYDVSEFPILRDDGFVRPTVDEELAIDQWGTFLSASAPIKDEFGNANELIGIDVEVSDFISIINLAFIPYILFVIFLLLILTSLTVSLVKIWGSRVDFLKELDRQKDELISIVSHQLATPITSIKWYVEMLLDGDMGKLTADQSEHIGSMKSVAADLSDLVGMILDVSRIQLGRVKIEKQELDLNVFFKEILEVIEPKAKEKKVEFKVSVPSGLPIAQLDKRYTRMTIENLLTNAIKYTPEKGVVDFTVTLENGEVHCCVKDTGCGIPKADQAKIFGKLFRASNVRNSVDGNGFGLYVAKGAVEAQGGKIWFESEENKGTKFFVYLPLGGGNEKVM